MAYDPTFHILNMFRDQLLITIMVNSPEALKQGGEMREEFRICGTGQKF
jgi:hypothetical protein